jgi:uncharacterized protein
MKSMVFLLLLICLPDANPVSPNISPVPSVDNPSVLLITGGHSFNEESFFAMIYSFDDITIDTLSQPHANHSLTAGLFDKYDAIVFYDMWQDISSREKEAFIRLTENGTGLVFLHHSLVSYQDWDLFEEIRGGKYYERGYSYPAESLSGYKHDINLKVQVVDPSHPVTNGIYDFEIMDEGYSNIGVLPGVTPLLRTDHPDCSEIIAWTNLYNRSRVVYLLLGHDENAWINESFRKIVYNAINWTTGK